MLPAEEENFYYYFFLAAGSWLVLLALLIVKSSETIRERLYCSILLCSLAVQKPQNRMCENDEKDIEHTAGATVDTSSR